MNYNMKPTLEHSALVRISVTMWSTKDVKATMAKFCLPIFVGAIEVRRRWQEVVDTVIEKAHYLPLPEPLKNKVLCIVELMGFQILKCIMYYDIRSLHSALPDNLRWTPYGTVDKKKTAEAVIKDQSLDIILRYKLACVNCLKEDIQELQTKIPFDTSLYMIKYMQVEEQKELIHFWTKENGVGTMLWNRIENRWQFVFEYAATSGNEVSTKYFFQKLTPQRKRRLLVRTAGYVISMHCDYDGYYSYLREYYADILCFLLTEMTADQQMEVFRNHPYKVLLCLLYWPWQDFFVETANHMWNYLSPEDYSHLLKLIVYKIVHKCRDYNYKTLYGEFWHQSPMGHKKYVVSKCASSGFFLPDLFKINKEYVRQFFLCATVSEKESIIFNYAGMRICENLIVTDKGDLLRSFILECISSRNLLIQFVREFKRYILSHPKKLFGERNEIWFRFYLLVHNLICSDVNKRSMGEGGGPPKKFHAQTFEEQMV